MSKRRALGQHYLSDPTFVRKIIAAAEPIDGRVVWEVGVGEGVLTEPLLAARPAAFRLFEIDRELIDRARLRWPDLEVVAGDAVRTLAIQDRGPDLLVGNLPYASATAIWRACCGPAYAATRLVFMFQREVADRLTGCNRADRGPLWVISSLIFTVRSVARVPPGAFVPPPKVESMVLAFTPRTGDQAAVVRRRVQDLFSFLVRGFQSRRKTLRNNLRPLGLDPEVLGIDGSKRPERLAPEEWWSLFRAWEGRD